jgi:hypothetical protein
MRSSRDVSAANCRPRERPRRLEPNQIEFFNVFGYLVLRDWLTADMDKINRGFSDALAHPGWRAFECRDLYDARRTSAYDAPRLCLPFAVDVVPALTWLRHHAGITAIARSLQGERWTYATSDTNLYNCDTKWHHDGFATGALYVYVMVYLDPLETRSGALRVLPGSHRDGSFRDSLRQNLMAPTTIGNPQPFGINQEDFPATAAEVAPGDVVVIDPRTFHASFGGKQHRRLITITFGPPPTREASQQFVAAYTTEASPPI